MNTQTLSPQLPAVTPLALPHAAGLAGAGRLRLPETVAGVALALQFPPGLLGHCAMPIQLALTVGAIGYMALRSGAALQSVSLQPVRYLFLVVLYFFVAHLIVEPESMSVAFIDLTVGGVGLVYIGTLLTTARPRDLLVALVLIHVVLATSDLVLVAARVAGLEQAIRLAAFPLKTYLYSMEWHFPFGFTYDQPALIGSMVVERALGIYREPGVYQAFALTACAAALLLRDLPWRRTMAMVILLGSASSLSTAWLASLGATAAWAMIARIDRRSAASLTGGALLLAGLAGVLVIGSFIPGLGFHDKLANESGQDRLRAFAAVGPALTASPWLGLGQGTLQGREAIDSVSGSFIVAVARLGIIGTLAFLFAAAATVFERHDRRSIVMLVPLAVTMLASQPLYYSVAAFFLLALPGREALAPPAVPRPLSPGTARPPVIPVEEPEPETPEEVDVEDALDEEEVVLIDDELDEECEDETIIPLVLVDDELDEECEDEAIIPLVITDEELDVVEASR